MKKKKRSKFLKIGLPIGIFLFVLIFITIIFFIRGNGNGNIPPEIPPEKDTDNDGIPDNIDQCPEEPETFNDFEDWDGCPDDIPEICDEGFKCKDVNTLGYQNSDCSWSNIVDCPSGCISGDQSATGIPYCNPYDNLPDFDLEQCIRNAVEEYYDQYVYLEGTISWIRIKTNNDIYEQGGYLWGRIGCTSVRQKWTDTGSTSWVILGVDETCSSENIRMMSGSDGASHNICGSNMVYG